LTTDICINAKGLTKEYRKGTQRVRPLVDLDLEVATGGFVSFMGPSGSGKTTLLNLLAGIDQPTGGTLHIAGTALHTLGRRQLTAWRATNIGYIFQLYHLVPVLSAYENVELPLFLQRCSAKERRRRVEEALDLVGLAERHDHYPRELSGGQEQRVAIARALIADPPLLVADEPTGDLDGKTAQDILDLLRRLVDDLGKTIVMVTHDPTAAAVADRQLYLHDGQLQEPVEAT